MSDFNISVYFAITGFILWIFLVLSYSVGLETTLKALGL